MNPVEKAHPRLVARCNCGDPSCVGQTFRARTADCYEDLDALPVKEQAAILCSTCACSGPGVPMAPYGSPVDKLVRAAYFAVPCLCVPRHSMSPDGLRDEWAEAEARLRTGKVRP